MCCSLLEFKAEGSMAERQNEDFLNWPNPKNEAICNLVSVFGVVVAQAVGDLAQKKCTGCRSDAGAPPEHCRGALEQGATPAKSSQCMSAHCGINFESKLFLGALCRFAQVCGTSASLR